MENINPFWHGTPVPPDKLINRQRELRTLIGRILTGQSTAISGAPRSGKTSLLHYLMAPPKKDPKISYGDSAGNLIFSYLDTQAWDTEFDIPKFWKETLLPLLENQDILGDSSFAKEYENCEKNAFGTGHLQKLLKQLKPKEEQKKEEQKGKRLVLMIDGTERLLRHPLNKTPFWGGMRHLASHSQGALVVILTTNTSVDEFYKKILTTTGAAGGKSSAYFNIMEEIILGPLADRDITQLLAPKNNPIFTEDDQRFLKDIAGGHPYFLQMAASILYEEERGSINSLRRVKEVFYGKVKSTLEDIWSSWSYSTQGAFISVALTQVKVVRNAFKKPEIDIDKTSRNVVSDYKTELDYLKSQGFLIADNNVPSGWRVCPSIFLPFILATKLKQEYREKMPKEVWDNLFDPTFGQT